MQEVDAICDEIVIVARGRSVAHGTAASLRAQTGCASLEDAFVALAFDAGADVTPTVPPAPAPIG
jgi:sodium transport system ATP-binding protein